MPFCTQCGTEVKAGASFCTSCGKNVDATFETGSVVPTGSSLAIDHGRPTCPSCSTGTLHAPRVSWGLFRTFFMAYLIGLFTVNQQIQMATERANAPRPEDLVFNPFYEHAPREYVPPDYSMLYIFAPLGLCIIVFVFLGALKGRYVCQACGHRCKP